MTSPESVGTVSVEVVASAKALAKSLKKETEAAFNGLDFSKAIQDAVGKTKIKLPVEPDLDTQGIGEKVRRTRIPKIPVEPDLDTDSIPEKVRKTRVPKVPVEVDPLMQAFQAEVRRQLASVSRTALKIPIDADGGRLRADVGAQIAAVRAQSRLSVPTEPGSKAEYEAKLKAQLAEVAARVKQNVKVDPDKNSFGGLGALFKGLTAAGPSLSGLTSGVSSLVSGLQEAIRVSASAGTSLSGVFTSAAGPIGIAISLAVALVAAMGAATVAAYALGPAVGLITAALSAAAGAAAAIPAALVGAGAVFGTLALGFKGITDAFKPKAGGGGGGGQSAAQQARQIAAAQRGVESARRGVAAADRAVASAERGYQDALLNVAQAQARAKQAQDAVNKALKEAVEDIDDLGRALRGAQLDEAEAAQGVDDALRALNEAKETGVLPDITRANLAYERAKLQLENAADAAQDLGEEQADAAKKGVEGSDKVVAALQSQADAQDGVRKAQEGVLDAQNAQISAADGLKSAQDGLISAQDSLAQAQEKQGASAAAAAAKTVKLAASAQAFVNAVKALKPAFEGLRLDVQQRLFEGLDKTVTNVGQKWIPALRITLGSYGDTFNGFFRNLGASITTPKFIGDIQAGAEGARQGLAKIGDSITTSLVPAFGTLSRAAGPFLSQLGTEIATIVTKFGDWVARAKESGALTNFFDRATTAMHDLFTTGTLVSQIIASIFEIITGSDKKAAGATGLERFNGQLQTLANYLKDPQNQQKIREFISDLKDVADKAVRAADGATRLIDKFRVVRQILFGGNFSGEAHSFGQDIGAALLLGIIEGMQTAFSLQDSLLKLLFVDAPLSLVGKINGWLGIHSPSTVMMETGGNLVAGIIQGITDRLPDLSGVAAQIRTTITAAAGNAGTWLVQHGRTAVDGLRTGISAKLGDLRASADSIRSTVQVRLQDAGSWLRTHGQAAATGLANGINSARSVVSTVAGNLRVYVVNPLAGAGSWLYNHGRAVIQGLINGIRSAIPALGSFLGDVGQFIKDHKGPIDKDRVLLFGAGQAIMDSLTDGLASRRGTLADELAGVTGQFGGVGADLDANLAAAVRVSAAPAPAPQALEVGFAPGANSDPLINALRSVISVKWRGDPMAALAT